MRFRSLFLDYKAEALQIMREEKEEEEEKLRQRVGDNETNAITRSRQKRVIRILVDPEEEAVPENADDEEETPSTDSQQQLPFWLSDAISNPTEEDSDEEDTHVNKVTTPVSKPARGNIAIGCGEDDSTDISGSDDATMSQTQKEEEDHNQLLDSTTDNVDERKPSAIDYNAFYASPWLLELVSSIRRRANRKRIANEDTTQMFYTQSYDCHSCFVDSFSHRVLRRAVDQHWIRNSWLAGWNRLEELLQIECYRKSLDFQVQNSLTRKDKSLGGTFSLSSWIRDGKGGFSSLSMHRTIPSRHTQHDQQSNALVVYRGHSVYDGLQSVDGNHQELLLTKKKENFSSMKLWETAILTAAVLCAYQKQEQQQQLKQMKEVISRESPPKDQNEQNRCRKQKRKVTLLYPPSHSTRASKTPPEHGINDEDERKNEPLVIDQAHRLRLDCDHPCGQEIENVRSQLQSRLLSPCSDNAVVSPSEYCITKKVKKRSPSPSQQEQEDQALRKTPRKKEKSTSELFHDSNTKNHLDVDSHPIADCSSKQNHPNRKTDQLDKRTQDALLFFRRFSKLSNTKRSNSNLSRETVKKSSVKADNNDASTRAQNEESNDSAKYVAGTTDFNVELGDQNVDYSSPIEFPNCFDDNEEEEQEEFTGDIVTEFRSKREPDSFQAVNATDTTPQSSNTKKRGAEYSLNTNGLAEVKVKEEPRDFLGSSFANPTLQSSNEKKVQTRKRRKRTTEEKMLRKKEKRRRRALNRENSAVQTECTSVNRADGKGIEKESDELEIPRKLNFREFSPAVDSRKEECIRNPPNQRIKCFHSPSLARVIRSGKCGSNDKDSEESSRLEEKCVVPVSKDEISTDDPFSISPEEILETIHCQTGQKEKQHSDFPYEEGIVKDKDSIGVLCSESFIENFGEIIAEIVRGNSAMGKSIRFTDTDLVDVCSVDIEIPSRGAIVVSSLSQIRNSGGIMVSFLPKVIELAAINRYDELSVFVCVDMLMDSAASRDLLRLQTAFLACERGLPRTQTSVQLCSKQTLAAFISRTISRSLKNSLSDSITNVDHWLSDSRTCQRLKFLLSVIPTLSVTGALHWLNLYVGISNCNSSQSRNMGDKAAEWFQRCFREVHAESIGLKSSNKARPKKLMNSLVPTQLVLAVNTRFNVA
mmetsp:Transcript_14615/g.36745  ORF Transcript_14615/g.36745 Transcript_14615/m.36745 type:complete len:1155 (+) Transcript_14615:175-3639(+)